MQQQLSNLLNQARIVPVLVIERLEDAVPLVQALSAGGLALFEITLRTKAALAAVEVIAKQLPHLTVGTGTVLNAADMQRSAEAGAQFAVSPGATDLLLEAAESSPIPLLPGASGPSEVMRLWERGYSCQKFFPAEAAGGTTMLKSIAGPLAQITFCPTGGIGLKNAASYLALPNVTCIGGSWIASRALLAEKNWLEITRRAQQAVAMAALAVR